MARRTLRDRLPEVAAAACAVFIEKGYRRAHVADVASRSGLSQGAVYGYVDSKEALFALALTHAIGSPPLDRLALPVPTPGPGALLEPLTAWEPRDSFPVLTAALRRRSPDDVRAEFAGVVDELYDVLERNRLFLSLVERSAPDLPELADLYYGRLRGGRVSDLEAYVRRRVRQGHFRDVPDAGIATRFVVETVAWFAWHRMDDREAHALDASLARATVGRLLVDALVPSEP